MGLSKTIILAPHILQLFIYFLYVVLTVNFDSVILMESELSFLVIRAQPHYAKLGCNVKRSLL